MSRITLKDLVDDTDIKMSKESGLKPELHAYQSFYNPLVLMCRLTEIGVDIRMAEIMARRYDKEVFQHIKTYLDKKYKR